eukprot:911533-Rhodomonas_salina.7
MFILLFPKVSCIWVWACPGQKAVTKLKDAEATYRAEQMVQKKREDGQQVLATELSNRLAFALIDVLLQILTFLPASWHFGCTAYVARGSAAAQGGA